MKNIVLYYIFFMVCVLSVYAQQNLSEFEALQMVPKTYMVNKISKVITIDGKDNEIEWRDAPWSDLFDDIEGSKRPKPKYATQIKMLWDSMNLYIYARMEEPHVWGDMVNYDDIIYNNNDFEVFIKPDVYQSEYYELEINALNSIFDLLLVKPYRFGGNALIHWDIKNLKSAVHIEGSLNNAKDIDKYWSLEIAIPFTAVKSFTPALSFPKPNEYWQINFSRVEWQHDTLNNTYLRKVKNNTRLPEDNWVWSPIGVVNMHFPERWGYIQFIDDSKNSVPTLPPYFEINRLTWNIHYLQKLYFDEHKQYTKDLKQLSLFPKYIQPFLKEYKIELILNSKKDFYTLFLSNKFKFSTTIDSKGNFSTN